MWREDRATRFLSNAESTKSLRDFYRIVSLLRDRSISFENSSFYFNFY
ncbi:hypothetical protein MADA3029_1180041 [Vibrio nigripulchritudo MADA3029]|nr:hypothetical protein VIBNIAM115_1300032 [Vibrio nigripulchritudo AM115]CCN43756.1 hypothetical protein VIBNIFTn2_600042 [Vibrio nigripulchritudo FTn2]CCN49096.1 hypothetical protein VIBNIMADA3020_70038 [Vibrio nigripulchritudo MADA3020]CCN56250.1 hypothetical protein VIBNIMADA3021_910038 [Vibrio nigripulchritudo MADA3021]CCN57818.1 hypothetical protein MADA3029_1180041 [Vibrio nigripulchritudo MADA3029]CCN65206.1 hypothetical protein VIBNIPon4_360031 [Vibrio nigripulchritudo POn4]CCN71727.